MTKISGKSHMWCARRFVDESLRISGNCYVAPWNQRLYYTRQGRRAAANGNRSGSVRVHHANFCRRSDSTLPLQSCCFPHNFLEAEYVKKNEMKTINMQKYIRLTVFLSRVKKFQLTGGNFKFFLVLLSRNEKLSNTTGPCWIRVSFVIDFTIYF
jgi:hypothetical protein